MYQSTICYNMKDIHYTQTDPLIYKNKIHFLPCKLYLYQNKYKMLLELKFNVIVIFFSLCGLINTISSY